jgi:hypothetical protein
MTDKALPVQKYPAPPEDFYGEALRFLIKAGHDPKTAAPMAAMHAHICEAVREILGATSSGQKKQTA